MISDRTSGEVVNEGASAKSSVRSGEGGLVGCLWSEWRRMSSNARAHRAL